MSDNFMNSISKGYESIVQKVSTEIGKQKTGEFIDSLKNKEIISDENREKATEIAGKTFASFVKGARTLSKKLSEETQKKND